MTDTTGLMMTAERIQAIRRGLAFNYTPPLVYVEYLLHDHELLLAVATAASPYLGTCRGHGNFGCEGVCGRAALCAALRACGWKE